MARSPTPHPPRHRTGRIALDRLVDVLVWTRRTEEVAEELWVDVPMLVALVQSLTDRERDWIDEQLRERGVA